MEQRIWIRNLLVQKIVPSRSLLKQNSTSIPLLFSFTGTPLIYATCPLLSPKQTIQVSYTPSPSKFQPFYKPAHSKTRSPNFLTENLTGKNMTTNGRKMSPEAGIELTSDTKVAAENGGVFVSGRCDRKVRRNVGVMLVVLRVVCFLTALTAVLVMASAKERSTMSIFGFNLPLYSNWSFSDSFEYLVGVSAAVAVHSLLQLLITVSRLFQNTPIIPSKNQAWLIFAVDQIFAYAMMSAGSAASGVTNLNRTGIKHSSLPNFCTPLHAFCNRVAISIAFTFFSCLLLAASAVLDVVWVAATTEP